MIRDDFEGLADGPRHDVCVIGAGPAGICLAIELARLGLSVLLLESGGRGAEPQVQALAAADIADPRAHDSMAIATARRLGGTSNLWGGRCLPYDPVDFKERPGVVDARWPITFDDVAPFYDRACRMAGAGPAEFATTPLIEPPPQNGDFAADSLERWTNTPLLQRAHARTLADSAAIEVRLHAVVTDIDFTDGGAVAAVVVARPDGSERARVPVRTLVLAAGGVETTRLLLAARRDAPDRFGGADGPLGRYYMGHVVGTIADVTLASKAIDDRFNFDVDGHGVYVRRRFVPSYEAQLREGVMNAALWPVVPNIWEAGHGSGILSAIYLALSFETLGRRFIPEALRKRHVPADPPPRLPHLRNVVRDLPAAVPYVAGFLWKRRFARSRIPGFYLHSAAYRYGLSFHSEQWPNPDSRITLTDQNDRLGLPVARIDYRFHERDVASVLRTHDLFERWLEESGVGRLDHRHAPEERGAAILAQAKHGTHQIGTARMGAHRREGVVDRDCRAFDAPNLYVASSAVLPTSGQANPTLTTIALALRLADLLARAARPTERGTHDRTL